MQKVSLKIIIASTLFLIALTGIKIFSDLISNKQTDPNIKKNNKILITTSFYPLYFFTKEIGGDKAEVINLTKTGGEPHDFEPSTKDIATIEKSRLLVVNGAFFENWLDKFSNELSDNQVEVLEVAENLANLKSAENNNQEVDAHVWLDPFLAQTEVLLISAKLQEIDPANAVFYQEKSKQLVKNLSELDDEFRAGLNNCQKNKIITSHAAFAYMAKRYGFEQIAIQGLNPDEDPSPTKIVTATKLAKENDINYIFFETLVSPKISETIAKEVGAKTLVFNPIEGLSDGEEQSGKNYFSIQRENLANLRLALACE